MAAIPFCYITSKDNMKTFHPTELFTYRNRSTRLGSTNMTITGCPIKTVSQWVNNCVGHEVYRGTDKSLARPDWKNNWKVAIFHLMQRSLLPRRPGWTGKPSELFLNGLQKLKSSVTVACFIPGRAKDSSGPWYILRAMWNSLVCVLQKQV